MVSFIKRDIAGLGGDQQAKLKGEELVLFHSKKFCSMLHQKEALICWQQKFVLSCTIFCCFYRNFSPFSDVTYHNYGAAQDEFLQPANQCFLLVQHMTKYFKVNKVESSFKCLLCKFGDSQIFPLETLTIIFPLNVIKQCFTEQNLVLPQAPKQNCSQLLQL